MLQKSMHEASMWWQNPAHELTFRGFRPFFSLESGGYWDDQEKV
jgi:hypothetical protein